MLGYLSLDIICSSKLTVFLELRSRKTVRFSEQIMSADKYPNIFSRQMKAIVYILPRMPTYHHIPQKKKSLPARRIPRQISREKPISHESRSDECNIDNGDIFFISRCYRRFLVLRRAKTIWNGFRLSQIRNKTKQICKG